MNIWLDDARAGNETVRHFSNPHFIVEARTVDQLQDAFAVLENARRSGYHLAGHCAYELGYALEPRLKSAESREYDFPLLRFGAFSRFEMHTSTAALRALQANTKGRCYTSPLRHDWKAGVYGQKFELVKRLIAAGDIYQANLSFRSAFQAVGDPMALYLQLRDHSKAAHGAFLLSGDQYILSLSPELFFSINSTGDVVAKPMKGTRPRAAEAVADDLLKRELRDSAKDRAENLMIVDLLRNDLGRIARLGSVRAEELFVVETYPTVHQMVSTVRATLKSEIAIRDMLIALFPCGSVTGAPKIRAMQIIRELETTERGAYCGAIGYLSPDGSAEFNVAIRTLTISSGKGQLGIGGAIVHDSLMRSEYEECLLKARYYEQARRPIELIETLRFSPQRGFDRVHRHLSRMQLSAKAFGIEFDSVAAAVALENSVADTTGDQRVRLALLENGEFSCTSSPIPEAAPALWRYRFSSVTMSSKDALLRHKTNWRDVYEAELSRLGSDEVLFMNEHGRVTEGSRTNIFVRRNGRLVTPRVGEGLLGGCLRQEMLESNACAEGEVYPEDLAAADEIFLGNSLRGLIRALPAKP